MLFNDQTDDVSFLILSSEDVTLNEQIQDNRIFIESDCAQMDDYLGATKLDWPQLPIQI